MPAMDDDRPVAIEVYGLDHATTGFVRMRTYDALSEPFRYDVEILSTEEDVRELGLIGTNATVRFDMGGGKIRYFNGYIESFGLVPGSTEYSHYELVLRPWFWFLTKTRASRIFRNKNVPDIVKEIFKMHGFSDHGDELSKTYKPREYCVQYNESDFDFVNRILEEEGIFYIFRHENGKHDLVLGDDISSNKFLIEPDNPVQWRLPGQDGSADAIDEWRSFERASTERFVMDDFDFIRPKAQLEERYVYDAKHKLGGFEIYDANGKYTESADGHAKAVLAGGTEQIHAGHVEGAGTVRSLAAGYNFTLQGHPISGENIAHTVYAVQQEIIGEEHRSGGGTGGGGGAMHRCRFVARPGNNRSYPLRRTPRPIVHGPQTAIVTGKSGEEIWTDEYGRVKVQFHWDRDSKADENSSCWVRVSQAWAGKNWGSINLPRIGQEVIIQFIEGDPDRPIITGRVYNGDAKTPYPLPEKATVTSFMTLSSKDGGGYNELRFEDKKGDEQVFIRAEKNLDVRVQNDQMVTTGATMNEIVQGAKMVAIGEDYHETIKGDSLHKISGDLQMKIDGAVAVDAGGMIALKSGNAGWIKAPKILLEGDTDIMLKVGGNSIYIGPAGIFIMGTMTMINTSPGGAVVLMPPMMSPVKEPKEADDGKPGEKTEAEAPGTYQPPQQQKPSHISIEFAKVLEQAHQTAAPFVDPADCPFAH